MEEKSLWYVKVEDYLRGEFVDLELLNATCVAGACSLARHNSVILGASSA
jgi:hypothetical protein